ncbi:MAG: ATP-binding cassette domain-containing protein [Butyrivibrio sp.]|nr:ATP-binding cassette domain-containing protein [Butyrivibrio sp.]
MIIEVKNVSKSYGDKKVLEDFSLNIESEHAYVVTGGEGAGKTTLVRIILGLEDPDKGKVGLLGDYKYPYIVSGTVFQDDRMVMSLNAVDNVYMVSNKLFRETVTEELLKLLPKEAIYKPVKELTKGQRRMVAIARACCIPNDVLIMDEPFDGLSEDERNTAIKFVRDKQGSGPLFITARDTHGLEFARIIELSV